MMSADPARNRREPPHGSRQCLTRLPPALFRAGLGPLFGRRVLLLHEGARGDEPGRRVVLDVIEHDPDEGHWTVASPSGPEATWYRDIRATPKTTIQAGNHHIAVTAHFPEPDEGGEIMARHAAAHPRAARRLCALGGFDADGSTHGYRLIGGLIPFVRLVAEPVRRLP
ncbi:nitroreductase/quinone reductase family protein [Streptomyces sp. NPDC059166]|uniref:nitroreductase/quinone reductase family protein n=1 Tax=Streptomyces sp. NPDC059166 TaxID=3346752 RepID=UPI0036CDEFBF